MAAELEGHKKLDRKLAKLPATLANKITRKALRDGSKIVLAKAKLNARSMVGGKLGKTLSKLMTIKAGKRSRTRIRMSAFFKQDESLVRLTKNGKRHYLPAIAEYGFKHTSGKVIPGKKFFRKAFDSTKGKMLRVIGKTMGDGIIEALKRG